MKPTYNIEDILGSRSRVAVLRVLQGVDVPLNASQIAARAGLTPPAVATVLATLSRMGIVASSPAGRATVHWMHHDNVYVETLVDPLFAAERQLPEILIADLFESFESLAVSVVLFGSYARGDQTPASDVDIALVAEDKRAKDVLESVAADYAVHFRVRFGASLSYLVYTRGEAAILANSAIPLAESIKRDGLTVAGMSAWEWANDAEG